MVTPGAGAGAQVVPVLASPLGATSAEVRETTAEAKGVMDNFESSPTQSPLLISISPDLVFSSFLFQHKTVKAIEFMICDALVAADEVIRLPGTITEARPDGMYKVGWCFCAWNVDGGIAC